jgi:hypothetical protein
LQNQGAQVTALGQHCLPDHNGCQVRTFALMDLPADNLGAEDVHDQVQIKEQARDRPRDPGNVPGPAAWQRMFTCARMRPCRARSPYNWWAVCAAPAAWHGLGAAAIHRRADCGKRWILRPDSSPDRLALAQSGLGEGWKIPQNYIATAQPRVLPRSACSPVPDAARGGADQGEPRHFLSNAAGCMR